MHFPPPFVWPIEQGYLGVTFFFVLSGFVLTWSRSASVSVSTFYTRRFARIWPSHIVALLLAIPVFYSFNPNPDHSWVKSFDAGVLALSVPLAQGWSRDPDILFSGNPAAWTLSCELLFYALHPLIMGAVVRFQVRGSLLLGAGSVVVAFMYRLACTQDPAAWWAASMPWPIARLPEFVLGIAIAWAVRRGWRPRMQTWPSVGIFLLGIGLISVLPKKFGEHAAVAFGSQFTNEIMTVLCGVVILGVTVSSLNGRRTWLESRPMVTLGVWSYAFYLVHATVIYALVGIVGYAQGLKAGAAWGAVALAAAIAGAYALHRWVEHPAERRIRAWKDRRDAQSREPMSH